MDQKTDTPKPSTHERVRPEIEPATEVEVAPKPRKKGGVARWVLLLLLAGGAAAGYYYYQLPMQVTTPAQHGRHSAPGDAPQPVGVATATTGDIRIVFDALGTVTPLATVTIKTQINGYLQSVAFTEGQFVKKGDFLAQIDPRPYEAQKEQFEGQLLRDQGFLDQAKADLIRYQTLLKQDSIAKQQAENQVYVVKQYQGSVKSDQAQVDQQTLNLTYCHIISPVTGRVGLRQVDAGNYVQTSDANGIVIVTQLDPISVIFTVPEDQLPAITAELNAGHQLTVQAFDRANTTHLADGHVTVLDNQVDTTTGTVKLRAEFANPDQKLFPNQFVNAKLLIRTLTNVVTVPNPAIQRGAPGTYVYLVTADDKVTVRNVKTGPVDGDNVQILSGLAPGDRVVIDGADRLRDGAKITIPTADARSPADANKPDASKPSESKPDAAKPDASKASEGKPDDRKPGEHKHSHSRQQQQ